MRLAASGTCARCWARPTSRDPPLIHLLSGNLSHQIEHHLFPDLPSNRYRQIAPRVRELFDRFGLRYHSAPLAAAGRECLAQGAATLPAQRLAGPHDLEQRARPDRRAVACPREPARDRRRGRLTSQRAGCRGPRRSEPATGAAANPPRGPRPVRPRVVRPPARAPARRPRSGRARTPDRGRPRTLRRGPHLARGVGQLRCCCRGHHASGRHRFAPDPATSPFLRSVPPSSGPPTPRAPRTACLPAPASGRRPASPAVAAPLPEPVQRRRPHTARGGPGHREGEPAVADQHRRGLGRRSPRAPSHEVLHAYRRHPSIVGATRSVIHNRRIARHRQLSRGAFGAEASQAEHPLSRREQQRLLSG